MGILIAGVILLILAYVLPDLLAVPPGIEHLLWVLGWIGVVVGVILVILRLIGHPVGGATTTGRRRYWL